MSGLVGRSGWEGPSIPHGGWRRRCIWEDDCCFFSHSIYIAYLSPLRMIYLVSFVVGMGLVKWASLHVGCWLWLRLTGWIRLGCRC